MSVQNIKTYLETTLMPLETALGYCIQSRNIFSRINTFKYHVFAPMGRFQLELIYLYFPPSFHLTVGFHVDVFRVHFRLTG